MTTDPNLDYRFDAIQARSVAAGMGKFSMAEENIQELVEGAERELDVRFEPSFRRYLERFNGGQIAGFELLWLVERNHSSWPDLVFATLDCRKRGLCLNIDVLVASDDGRDFYVRHSNRDQDVAVYVREPGPTSPLVRYASNYVEFLERSIADLLR